MNQQFIFFCVNIGNEKLLKTELACFYPELSLSYSRKGFLTFKNSGVQYSIETISQLQATFATRVGLSLGKCKQSELTEHIRELQKYHELDELNIHCFSVGCEFELSIDDIDNEFDCVINDKGESGDIILNLITLSENEIWYGLHRQDKGITRYANSDPKIIAAIDAPSIGYLKLAQIFELYSLSFKYSDNWLDFGSSPGGASLYLIEHGAKVYGVDTASNQFKHKNYNHIKAAVQDLSQERLPENIHWVHSDLNLKPTQAIKEVLRLCKKYNDTLRGIIFTVQLTNLDYIKELEDFEDIFYDWGFHEIKSVQVPTHKNEYTIIARR